MLKHKQEEKGHKQVEESIKAAHAELDQIFNIAGNGMRLIDKEFNTLRVNKTFSTLAGLAKNEAMGKKCYEVFRGPLCQTSDCPLVRILEGEDRIECDTYKVRRDGLIIPCIITAAPFLINGELIGIVEDLKDITERKLMEEELRKAKEEAEAKYLALVKQAKDGVAIIQDNVWKFVNNSMADIIGYSAEEMIGKPFWHIVENDYKNLLIERYQLRLAGIKVPTFYEAKFQAKNGTIKDMEISAGIIQYQGKPATLAIFRDITEHKKVVRKLLESERNLTKAQEITKLGSYSWDLVTNQIEWSDQMYRLFGFKPGEISPKYETFLSFIHPDDRDRTKKIISQTMHEGKPGSKSGNLEFRFIRKDGTERIMLSRGEIIYDERGRPIKIIGTDQDITERKRMEEELQRIDKLESIGLLAGGIAHDFNNILVSIVGTLSLLKRHVEPESRFYKLLTRAERASHQARDLTRQLLTFSKGGAPIKKTASMSELLRDIAVFSLRGSHIRCDFSISDQLYLVEVDKGQISQVINNLIMNAEQAMPKGGIIKISAENVNIEARDGLPLKEGKYIKISIEDEGCGIPEEYLHKIFDPYFTTKPKGNGLGLAISYAIVKQHEGYLTVKSTVGDGTTFYVYLPASEEKFIQESKGKENFPSGQGRILLMDDEEGVRETVKDILEDFGFEVRVAGGDRQAIEFYKKAVESGQPFDAVILDLTIPGGMGGKDVILKLIEINPMVKAIASSGYSNNPVMSNYKKYGFSGVVAKPYAVEELIKVLHDVITQEEEQLTI